MKLKSSIKWLLGVFTRRAWLKALSIVLALILWAYIVGNNSSITRNKTIPDLTVYVGSTGTLTARNLALSTDVLSEYQNKIDAIVKVPQNRFSRLTQSSVRVTPDYSGIYRPGTYEVPLTASSTYGTVTKLVPDTITVVIEELDTRDLQVEIEFANRDNDAFWYGYDASVVNPQVITISGPASLIQSVTDATAVIDVKDRTQSFRRSQIVTFNTADGGVFDSKLLTKSSSTCSVKVDVYPKKTLPVKLDESRIEIAPGYTITSISFNPSTITVAAPQDVLDNYEYLLFELGVAMPEATKTFTTRLTIRGVDDFKYISAKQVYATITISEIED